MRALLDINVLLALFDSNHQFHAQARTWLEENIEHGWASCPITQNGFVRIISQPSYPDHVAPKQAIDHLTKATRSRHHRFWADDVSILDDAAVDRTRIHGPKQLTDNYLLALAVRHAGCFVTFDSSVPVTAVRGATPAHLRTI